MAKTFLYRMFGLGKIPETLLTELKTEGVLLVDEGVKGTITYRDYRAPGRYSNWKRQWFTASIALTKIRLIGLRYSATIFNVPFTDARIRKLRVLHEADEILLIAFDATLFFDASPDMVEWRLRDASRGTVECRFHTPQAQIFVDKLREIVG